MFGQQVINKLGDSSNPQGTLFQSPTYWLFSIFGHLLTATHVVVSGVPSQFLAAIFLYPQRW